MNIEELIVYIKENNITSGRCLSKRIHSDARERIMEYTEILTEIYGEKASTGLRLEFILSGRMHPPKCSQCDSYVALYSPSTFGLTCSKKCAAAVGRNVLREKPPEFWDTRNEKTKQTYINKAKSLGLLDPESYTSASAFDDVIEKRKQTMSENWDGGHNMRDQNGRAAWEDSFISSWGVKNPMQVPEIQEKAAKIDGEWFVSTPEFKEKQKTTFKEKYGSHPMRSETVKSEIKKRNMEKYGREYPNQSHISEESLDILSDKSRLTEAVNAEFLSDVAMVLGVHQSTVQRACAIHNINVIKFRSKAEQEISEMIESLGFEVINNKKRHGHELDIYVPSKNLAIEFNGIYWHSELYRSRSYHQRKSIDCMAAQTLLMHVWEDDWCDPIKKSIIISKIKAKLGVSPKRIFGRNTHTGIVTRESAKEFFTKNHIQGHVDATVYIGLTHEDELVAVMGFKKCGGTRWDLSRFASSCSVVGGMSKCLSFFKRNYEWSEIFTFASLDYSHGNSYEKCGFVNNGFTAPNLWYVKTGEWKRLGRRRFVKSKLPSFLDTFDESLSAKENLNNNGYLQIFDAGSIKYTTTP